MYATDVVTHYQFSTRSHDRNKTYKNRFMNDIRIQLTVILLIIAAIFFVALNMIAPTIITEWNSFSVEFLLGFFAFVVTSLLSTTAYFFPKFSAIYQIVFYNLYSKGDTVKIGNIVGVVEKISFFHTYIREPDGDLIVSDNTDIIQRTIYNYTKEKKSIIIIHAKLKHTKASIAQGLLNKDYDSNENLRQYADYILKVKGINSTDYWISEVTETFVIIVAQYDIDTKFNTQLIISKILFALKHYLGVSHAQPLNSNLIVGNL